MAGIKITGSGAKVNPTNKYLPFNSSGIFGDSMLRMSAANRLAGMRGPTENGIYIDNNAYLYKIGDFAVGQNGYGIIIDDTNRSIELKGIALINPSSSGNSGDHLCITVNGTAYKIQLLNP
jgi:hypothetical protein